MKSLIYKTLKYIWDMLVISIESANTFDTFVKSEYQVEMYVKSENQVEIYASISRWDYYTFLK